MLRWDWSSNHEFHVCVIFQALHGAQTSSKEMSSVAKIKFVVAEAASAASGRSAGTKRKKQVKDGKGPVEKKACGTVTQPALPPEELKRICLSANRLKQWCHMPFFATTVTGCFVRVPTNASISNPHHCIAEIVSVMEIERIYQFGSKRTNMGVKLRHGGQDQIVTLKSASNQEFTISEFTEWKQAVMAAGAEVPTPEMIANKEKSIREALDHTFTEEEIDFIVAKNSRFREAPVNIAKRKIQLLAKQSAARSCGNATLVKEIQNELKTLMKEPNQLYRPMRTEHDLKNLFPHIEKSRRPHDPEEETEEDQQGDPFNQRKTRPIIFTSLKIDSVRQRVDAELGERYGCESEPEDQPV